MHQKEAFKLFKTQAIHHQFTLSLSKDSGLIGE